MTAPSARVADEISTAIEILKENVIGSDCVHRLAKERALIEKVKKAIQVCIFGTFYL